MKYRVNGRLTALTSGLAAAGVLQLAACTGAVSGNGTTDPVSTGGSGGSAATTGGSGTIPGGNGPIACDGSTVSDPKRIVRLSFNQISNTMRALFGDALGQKLDADF